MDRQYVRDAQIIERYLQGRLTPAEEQAFEEAYLADPEILDELQVAERLREGLKELGEEAAPAGEPPRRAGWLTVVSSPRYGIAASLVAAVAVLACAVLYWQVRDFAGSGASSTAAGTVRLFTLVSVRGAGNPNVIAASSVFTVLLLDPGFTDYDRYRAVLARKDGAELLRADGLTRTDEGLVALGVPARLLTSGDYEVRLEGGRSDWPETRELDELNRTPLTIAP